MDLNDESVNRGLKLVEEKHVQTHSVAHGARTLAGTHPTQWGEDELWEELSFIEIVSLHI